MAVRLRICWEDHSRFGTARGSVDNPALPDSGLAAAQLPVDSPWTTRRPPPDHRSAVAHEFHRLQGQPV
jgi:hypothetical protein